MTKISVIIPVYNVEKYLRECLESVVNQTLKDIEIICIDDGSTDLSLSILEKYAQKDGRVKILHTNKLGGGAARNAGLAIATGDYLSFLDSDDFFEHNMLNTMYHKAVDDKLDIVICDIDMYNDSTGKYVSSGAVTLPDFIAVGEVFNYKNYPKNILNYFQNAAWNKLYRTEFVRSQDLKFQEIRRTNDLLFTKSAIVLAERVECIKDIFVHYRFGMKSNCQSNNHKYPLEFLKSLVPLKNMLIARNLYEEVGESYKRLVETVVLYNFSTLEEYALQYYYLFLQMLFKHCVQCGISVRTLPYKNLRKIFLREIFSVRNSSCGKYKVLTLFGIKLRFKK